jgi:hypothetical protein
METEGKKLRWRKKGIRIQNDPGDDRVVWEERGRCFADISQDSTPIGTYDEIHFVCKYARWYFVRVTWFSYYAI